MIIRFLLSANTGTIKLFALWADYLGEIGCFYNKKVYYLKL